MNNITVYSKDNCSNCEATKNLLNNRGIDFEEVNISHDEEGLNFIKENGYKSVPVTITDKGQVIQGFNINELSQLS